MPFTAGARIRASDLNQLGKLVARSSRTSNTASAPGPTSVLSVRGPVIAGRSYLCSLQTESFGSVAANQAQHDVRYTTNDVEPVTASPGLFRGIRNHPLVGIPETVYCAGIFDCTVTGFLRLLHQITRASGTGNVAVGAGATFPTILSIEDIGDTIASSGTIY